MYNMYSILKFISHKYFLSIQTSSNSQVKLMYLNIKKGLMNNYYNNVLLMSSFLLCLYQCQNY